MAKYNFLKTGKVPEELQLGIHAIEKLFPWKDACTLFETNEELNYGNKLDYHVVNLSSQNSPTFKDLLFFNEIVSASFYKSGQNDCTRAIMEILNSIPVFLVKRLPEDDDDLYGYYTRLNQGCIPSIFICYDRIRMDFKEDNKVKHIFTKVLIHEFAHAIMDFQVNQKFRKKGDDDFKKIYKWFEEGLANMITLIVAANSSNRELFQDVEDFIEKQRDEYKFGKILYNSIKAKRSGGDPLLWIRWRRMKINNFNNINDDIKQKIINFINNKECDELFEFIHEYNY